jgi:hypothetical protein
VCLLLALTVSPFLANLLGTLAKHVNHGALDVAGFHIELPGVRLALWLGGAVTLLSGLAARVMMRRSSASPARGAATA